MTTIVGSMDIGKLPRGEDFANKYAKGEWAELVLIETIDDNTDLFAFQYGISRGDALETKEQLDRVKEPGVEETKRPDVLVFTLENFEALEETEQVLVRDFITSDPDRQGKLLPKLEAEKITDSAIMALEAESSKFNLSERQYNSSLSAYVKDEDLQRLQSWRDEHEVPIFVCQLFFDRGYIIPFSAYENTFQNSVNVRGFKHGKIPNIPKKGLQAKVEGFPASELLGWFTKDPDVVTDSKDGTTPCDYRWTRAGKLEAASSTTAFFQSGEFEFENPLTDYI
jgi:hypothetical protein